MCVCVAGVPPPPPPGGGPALPPGLKPKKNLKPRIKMKQLNWTKIPTNKVKGSYWDSLDDENIKLDFGTNYIISHLYTLILSQNRFFEKRRVRERERLVLCG